MCGIAGFTGQKDLDLARAVAQSLAHRGPDASTLDYIESAQLHLVHRRLAVLDLTGGDQPMWSQDGSVGIVFNGEIYNHMELRAELMTLGYLFQTENSDTECLVNGYLAWGADLVRRLNGMFAFAIVDLRKQELYLARDRFGEKPLYIFQNRNTFAFASEVQAFSELPGVSLDVDPLALAQYFSFGFLPRRRSLFSNVGKLGAGEHLRLQFGAGAAFHTRDWRNLASSYWTFELSPDESRFRGRSDADVAEEFWEHFARGVQRRLISDVPIGVFLSGGLDSSAVLAAMVEKRSPDQIDCFTIGFNEKSFDESPYAVAVAKHFGCRHHLKRFDASSVMDGLDHTLPAVREPLADPSILPTAMLAAFTRERVTVALSGDGGDELLAGYDPFLALRFAELCHRLALPFAVDLVRQLLRLLPKKDDYMSFDFKVARALEGIAEERPLWEPVWMGPLSPSKVEDAFGKPYTRDEIFSDVFEVYESIEGASSIDQALTYFTRFYLTDSILVKSDRATMLSSLESRAVFLDNDFVDFCRYLPTRYKMLGRSRKHILKLALSQRIPRELIERRKQGFGLPMSKWLRDTRVVNGPNRVPFLNETLLNEAKDQHNSFLQDHRLFLFAWLAANRALA